MKKFIFLFLGLFLVFGVLDVRSDSPPEKQSYEVFQMPIVDAVSFEVANLSIRRYGTIEGFINIYLADATVNENGKPINKARDKLSFIGVPVASIKGFNSDYNSPNWTPNIS